jgi:signal peptidase I
MDQPPAETAPPSPPKRKPRSSSEASVKDTIESILVAFMLAFIFRAFVVEAFVIPTGSMAPTLLGAHMRFRCPDCGYQFDVNFQGVETGLDEIRIDPVAYQRTFALFCPNCGYRLPRLDPEDPTNDAYEPTVRYGDRILVLKYLYLLKDPSRWDVVVFKSPYDPDRYDYTQNYIKRLIGRPGEAVMVLDGDIYISNNPDTPLDSFEVQTKPPRVQNALWRIVYNNDYLPRGRDRSKLVDAEGNVFGADPPWEQPWQPQTGGGWSVGEAGSTQRDLRFANLNGAGVLRFDADANPSKHALTDWLAYDVTENQGSSNNADTYRIRTYDPENNVSDIKLDFFYQRRSGDGPLAVELTKGDEQTVHRFSAQITPTTAALFMDGQLIAGPTPISQTATPIHVEVMNVDYRVSVAIDGREVVSTTPQQYHPDLPRLMEDFRLGRRQPKPQISIHAERQDAILSHVSLWRDTYYLNRGQRRSVRDPYARNALWASPENFPENLAKLGPDEFFVMGDNSFVSLDARYWDDAVSLPNEALNVRSGRVPRRFMLGKAFFVYWPAGFPPINSAPGIAPDFGDMRFIR